MKVRKKTERPADIYAYLFDGTFQSALDLVKCVNQHLNLVGAKLDFGRVNLPTDPFVVKVTIDHDTVAYNGSGTNFHLLPQQLVVFEDCRIHIYDLKIFSDMYEVI